MQTFDDYCCRARGGRLYGGGENRCSAEDFKGVDKLSVGADSTTFQPYRFRQGYHDEVGSIYMFELLVEGSLRFAIDHETIGIINVTQSTCTFAKVDDFTDRRHTAIGRVKAFEDDNGLLLPTSPSTRSKSAISL